VGPWSDHEWRTRGEGGLGGNENDLLGKTINSGV